MSKAYEVKYRRTNSKVTQATRVKATSESQAREQVKAKFNGDVIIISTVEK